MTPQFSAAADSDMLFPEDLQGLPGLSLRNDSAHAFVSRQGAQVLSWQGSDGKERLYVSPKTGGMKRGEAGGTLAPAIRAGIPISFPQFSGRGPLPKHGFIRNIPWQLTAGGLHEDGARRSAVTLTRRDDTQTHAIWPQSFHAETRVTLEPDRLIVSLSVTNSGSTPWEFTAALHTYLRVDDIRNTRLSGLQNVRYQDATANNVEVVQQDEDVLITQELDRVYLSPPKELLLLENGLPALRIAQQGFEDTVVWNPGPEKARGLGDMPDEDWLHMLCVEAACVNKPVLLQPGQRWSGQQTLTIAST